MLAHAVGGRGQPKPAKLKRVSKLKDQGVVSSACGGHATAMASKDGKLHMFGNLEEELVDKSSGQRASGRSFLQITVIPEINAVFY